MSDHTQSIPRVGGSASTAQNQGGQSSSGYAPRASSPTTSAIPTNGRAAASPRTSAPPTTGGRAPSQPWSPTSRTQTVPPSRQSAPVTPPAPTAGSKRGAGNQRAPRGPRKARLQLRHVDTWSALKISLVLSVVMFFVWMVAVGILYGVMSGLDVFDQINELWGQLGSEEGGTTELVTPGLVFGGAALIGAINIVLFTALATIATYIYNLSADLVGGLEVTLTERE